MSFTAWTGTLAWGPWWLLCCGPIGASHLHQHTAFQVVVHGGAPCLIDDAGEAIAGPIAVVEPDRPHAIHARRDPALVVFIEPTSRAGWHLRARGPATTFGLGHPVAEVIDDLAADSWSRADELVRRTLAMAGVAESLPLPRWWRYPAVDEALLLAPDVLDYDDEQLSEFTAATGLSMDNLERMFSTEVGIPLQSYARWLRLVRGCELLVRGVSAWDAARAAHFADADGLRRQLDLMFGLSPADIASARTLLS